MSNIFSSGNATEDWKIERIIQERKNRQYAPRLEESNTLDYFEQPVMLVVDEERWIEQEPWIDQLPVPWRHRPDKYLAPKVKKEKLPLTFDNLMELVAKCQRLANEQKPEGFTRTFHIYGRVLLSLLDPYEYVVLTVLIEEIFGFGHDCPEDGYKYPITLGRFTHGQRDGNKVKYIALGCGLSEPKVRAVLKALEYFGIARQLKGNNPEDNYGNLWFLQPEYSKIDWKGLWERRELNKAGKKATMKKVREERENTTPPRKTKRNR